MKIAAEDVPKLVEFRVVNVDANHYNLGYHPEAIVAIRNFLSSANPAAA